MSVESLQFVDTNILIYAHDTQAGIKYKKSKALLQKLWDSQRGFLSIQVLQEFYINITRHVAKPLNSDQATEIISSLSVWKVHSPTTVDVQNAIRCHQKYKISFWDAMIIQSASQLRCDQIWSEDLNHDQTYDGVKVVNPFIAQIA